MFEGQLCSFIPTGLLIIHPFAHSGHFIQRKKAAVRFYAGIKLQQKKDKYKEYISTTASSVCLIKFYEQSSEAKHLLGMIQLC